MAPGSFFALNGPWRASPETTGPVQARVGGDADGASAGRRLRPWLRQLACHAAPPPSSSLPALLSCYSVVTQAVPCLAAFSKSYGYT